MPRLPSLRLSDALELDEKEEVHATTRDNERYGGGDGDADGEFYEGNSMTLADILLQAGHPGTAEEQLLEEDELQGDMSDWE